MRDVLDQREGRAGRTDGLHRTNRRLEPNAEERRHNICGDNARFYRARINRGDGGHRRAQRLPDGDAWWY